ncbi:MAG: DUF1902 domain-containing protein [Burkholderiaceae bacterium]|jgi:hypothetical protein|nr:DUF1902 domain-containing protein [Burkholderiaceae bacterium]
MTDFTVTVIYDQECSMWIAECDALHLVTEASTYEALTERAWLIAPDLFLDNNLSGHVKDMRLSFVQEHTVQPDVTRQHETALA